MTISREDAQTILNAGECFCGNWKRPGQAFCLRDYLKLTRSEQRSLFKSVGRGFEAGYTAARAAIRKVDGEQR